MEEKRYGIMSAEYRRGLNKTVLLLKKEGGYQEDYQMRMLEENEIKGFLKVTGRGVDNISLYEYDVSGKYTMKSCYQERKIRAEEMKAFLEELLEVIEEMAKYLLDADHLLLDAEYIFREENAYEFCYYPGGRWDIWKAFHKLTEYFVEWTDYQDDASVKTAFLLHKETMKENYSLENIMDKIKEMECQTTQEDDYDTKAHDWIAEQEMGSHILRETDNMWNPVKNFLNRRKKSMWGEWGDIYIEEDDL